MLHKTAAALAALSIIGSAHASEPQMLTTAVIQGSTAYSPAELFESYRDQLGKPVTRDSARAIVTELQEMYARDGYSKPELALDGDLAARGILQIDVFEPHITAVKLSGDAGPHAETLAAATEELRQRRPLRREEMQNTLRQLRELPGLAVTANTRRDEAVRNGFELLVDASFRPVDSTLRLTNRGTGEIGPVFALGQFVANGLFGIEEKIGVLTATASEYDEFHGGGLFVDVPTGLDETRAMLMAFRSTSNPTEAGDDVDDQYMRDRMFLKVTHRLDGAARVHWTAYGQLELEDLEIEQDGAEMRDDQLRILTLGTRIGWRSGDSLQHSATIDALQGLDALGAGLDAQDLAIDERSIDFTALKLTYMLQVPFAEHWSVRLDVLGQYSNDVVPDSQRFKIGGDRLGRGFEVAEIAGDSGAGGKLELRRGLSSDLPVVGKTSAYAFYDLGAAWKSNASGRESAATAGLGVAISGTHISGSVEVATPLTGTDIEGSDATSVFGELTLRF